MQTFLEELQELKADVMQRFRNKEITSSYALKTMKDYIYCYREATNIYFINSRHKIEPDTEVDTTPAPDEVLIDNALLSDENMQNRLQLLQKVMEGKSQ